MVRLFAKILFFAWLSQLGASILVGMHQPAPAPAVAPNPLGLAVPPLAADQTALFLAPFPQDWPLTLTPSLELSIVSALLTAALLTIMFFVPFRRLRQAIEAIGAERREARVGTEQTLRHAPLADVGLSLDRLAGRVEAQLASKHRLLQNFSHQMLCPLSRIKLGIGLARQQPERIQAALQRIERESNRMDRLVSDLLTLSQVELRTKGTATGSVELRQLIADVVADARLESNLPARAIRFYESDIVRVHGNAELLHRAIANLVRNAVRRAASQICVRMLTNGRLLHVVVSDDGPALSDAEREQLFQPFYGSPNAPDGEGHGLELAIASRIVATHGGGLQARDARPVQAAAGPADNGGLLVEMTLPVAQG